MERKMKGELLKRLLAIALTLIVAVTFVPLLGDIAYADDEQEPAVEVEAEAPDGDVTDPTEAVVEDPVDVTVEEPTESAKPADPEDVTVEEPTEPTDPADVTTEEPAKTEAVEENAEPVAEEEAVVESEDDLVLDNHAGGKITGASGQFGQGDIDAYNKALGMVSAQAASKKYTLRSYQKGNRFYLTGKIKNKHYQFGYIVIDVNYVIGLDGTKFANNFNGDYIDLADYGTGYHTVAVIVMNKDTHGFYSTWEKRFAPCNTIKTAPNYSGKFYYVYSNYMNYYPFTFGGNLSSNNLYMEYTNNGGKSWARTNYMKANAIQLYMQQGYTFRGLRPNTNYVTRLRYGTYVTYTKKSHGNGKTYFFGGPVRNVATIKTGAATAPKIKSVKVKAIKVKKHKVRHYGYYTGVYLYTEKFYTYKLKVTVKLKKKPGTQGLWINGKFVKGNKKKYKVVLPGSSYSYKKPKGKKFTVGICSYQSSVWGGLSPLYKKVKKIK